MRLMVVMIFNILEARLANFIAVIKMLLFNGIVAYVQKDDTFCGQLLIFIPYV